MMNWLAYAGLCIVGIGCFVLMVALIEYQDYREDLAENMANSDFCEGFSGNEAVECTKGMAISLSYLADRQNDIYRTLALAAIGVGSGMVLFITSYLRPSWFSHSFPKPADLK